MEQARKGPVPMADAIRAFLRESGAGKTPQQVRVFQAWSDNLPPDEARLSQPVRFQRGNLTVEVGSSAHLYELKNFKGEGYRKAANQQLGRETIRKVAYRLKS